jgi:hypothetical protein
MIMVRWAREVKGLLRFILRVRTDLFQYNTMKELQIHGISGAKSASFFKKMLQEKKKEDPCVDT